LLLLLLLLLLLGWPRLSSSSSRSSAETSEDADPRRFAVEALGRRDDGLGRRLPLLLLLLLLASSPSDEVTDAASSSSAEASELADPRRFAVEALGRRDDGLGRRLPLLATSSAPANELSFAICAFMRAIKASLALVAAWPPRDRLRPLRKPASRSAASAAAARAAAATWRAKKKKKYPRYKKPLRVQRRTKRDEQE
jgi:hypothetical protein